ncbi:colanic acid/amylovoran biosynthesis protein [Constrictibacter sp. MBR-5]|jgi:polysaccharide pyruvyl transferase WcaK-like protein|uniref:polysaccharide pyruvyl transferase family protein n=1 Tax=Constrictibacter sp. MBR-5 TaxID=3156467 RepID=UPI00339186CD
MLRVGLLWHSLASGNLGVRALTLAQLAILETAAEAAGREVEAVIFGHPDWGAPRLDYAGRLVRLAPPHDLTAVALFRRTGDLLGAFRRCDLLIDIGEGDSFTDVYGWRRYVKQLASKALALRSGRPLILAPQTIGPFGRGRRLPPAALLRRAAHVFARDAESEAFARRLAPTANLALATDVAFLLPWEAPARPRGGPLRIGLNVSGLLYQGRGFGLPVPYAALVDALLADWTGRAGYEVHLVAHVLAAPGEADQDGAVSRQLARRFPAARLAPAFTDPRAAKSWIAGLDFFVGARMHACVAAFSAGVPLVPLAYTRKATGLFRSLGYDAVADLRSGSLEDAVRIVGDGLAGRAALAAAAAAGNRRAAERLRVYTDLVAHLVRTA